MKYGGCIRNPDMSGGEGVLGETFKNGDKDWAESLEKLQWSLLRTDANGCREFLKSRGEVLSGADDGPQFYEMGFRDKLEISYEEENREERIGIV
jgi:hypothetical protein